MSNGKKRTWTKRRKFKVGDKIGKLTLLEKTKHSVNQPAWWCECECNPGVRLTHPILDGNLKRKKGPTRSCGCEHSRITSELHTTHGCYYEPLHGRWRAMIDRCHNPNDSRYPGYGGREVNPVKVCARWHEYQNFKYDMLDTFREELEIHRPENEWGYWCGRPECSECGPLGRERNGTWVTSEVNRQEKRKPPERHNMNGRLYTIRELCDMTEGRVSPALMRYRLRNERMDPEEAVRKPVSPRKKLS